MMTTSFKAHEATLFIVNMSQVSPFIRSLEKFANTALAEGNPKKAISYTKQLLSIQKTVHGDSSEQYIQYVHEVYQKYFRIASNLLIGNKHDESIYILKELYSFLPKSMQTERTKILNTLAFIYEHASQKGNPAVVPKKSSKIFSKGVSLKNIKQIQKTDFCAMNTESDSIRVNTQLKFHSLNKQKKGKIRLVNNRNSNASVNLSDVEYSGLLISKSQHRKSSFNIPKQMISLSNLRPKKIASKIQITKKEFASFKKPISCLLVMNCPGTVNMYSNIVQIAFRRFLSVVELEEKKIAVEDDQENNENKSECESENKPECESKNKPECESENKPECESKNKPECESENKPECESENKPECKIENKPECESENKPECESENKSECENAHIPIDNEQTSHQVNSASFKNFRIFSHLVSRNLLTEKTPQENLEDELVRTAIILQKNARRFLAKKSMSKQKNMIPLKQENTIFETEIEISNNTVNIYIYNEEQIKIKALVKSSDTVLCLDTEYDIRNLKEDKRTEFFEGLISRLFIEDGKLAEFSDETIYNHLHCISGVDLSLSVTFNTKMITIRAIEPISQCVYNLEVANESNLTKDQVAENIPEVISKLRLVSIFSDLALVISV